jgi:hypothetical protein
MRCLVGREARTRSASGGGEAAPRSTGEDVWASSRLAVIGADPHREGKQVEGRSPSLAFVRGRSTSA